MLGNVDRKGFALPLSFCYQLNLSKTDVDQRMNESLKYEQSSKTEPEQISCVFDSVLDVNRFLQDWGCVWNRSLFTLSCHTIYCALFYSESETYPLYSALKNSYNGMKK